MSYLRTCPRCNERGYEVLKTHAFCVSCNYSPDLMDRPRSSDDLPIPAWAEKVAAQKSREKIAKLKDETEESVGGVA
ncbi:MAG: hypothetical protein AB7K68_06310 [Bacteriovoracia bacterium]